ncbi:MAG: glycosyltransferase, partial [Flavobacteriales bacterium]|nr:glycosyltransferase [Flavobacteriales bacterium]
MNTFDFLQKSYLFVNTFIFIYAISVSTFYILLAIFAFKGMRRYKLKDLYFDKRIILSSEYSPALSLIAPAYNESLTVIDNIRSLLSLHYSNLEVIIVNDGSKDDTLQKCIETFEMEPVDFAVNYAVNSKEIKTVYKAKNPAYRRLVLVDKDNGGKADALNAG